MLIEVSVGEAIDKYSILELKVKKITDPVKNNEILKELDALKETCFFIKKYEFFYSLLLYINEKIWNLTDEIKQIKPSNVFFATLSNQIFEYNQKRFRLKNFFNILCDSSIKEQKSYSTQCCKVYIQNEEILLDKIAELNYLTIEYDFVYLDTQVSQEYIKNIFQAPTIIFTNEIDTQNQVKIDLNEYMIEPSFHSIFEFKPITYIAGGKMGDFIQSLSVINENFYNTGKKGCLYLSNKGDSFHDLNKAYHDTYDLITFQRYISSYQLVQNGMSCTINIDLTLWRNSPLLFNQNWCNIFSNFYSIPWGKHKWLTSLEHKQHKIDKNCILISTTSYRFPVNLDYKSLIENFKSAGNLIFYMSQTVEFYDDFINRTGLSKDEIELCQPTSFAEMCNMIDSCKLFIGNLSAPLAIAFAYHKEHITGFPGTLDDIHNKNL